MLMSSDRLIDQMVGISEVKTEMQSLISIYQSLKQRAAGGSSVRLNINSLVLGNTGTGKTTLAYAIQDLLLANNIISNKTLCIVDAVDYEDFAKGWDNNIKAAKGGILFIDNAQKLLPQGYADNVNDLDKLFVEMGRWNNDPMVILAGLPGGFETFLNTNPAVANRFRYTFNLPDYTYEELRDITINKLKDKFMLTLSDEALAKLNAQFKYIVKTKDESFGNGHLSEKKSEEIFRMQSQRVARDPSADPSIVLPGDIGGYVPEDRTVEQIIGDLDDFVGMESVKDAVRNIALQVQAYQERIKRGLPAGQRPAMHMVLTGNPGTGKTTIARKLGEILEAIGFLDNGNVVEVDREKMVSQYVGETPKLVDELCNQAMGGILFVDEAYTLAPQSQSGEKDKYGTEAIEKLMKRMEDDRDKFVVIAAGYRTQMNNFLGANPGLKSRFDQYLHIEDYTPEELLEIYKINARKKEYYIEPAAEELLHRTITQIYNSRDKNFGNGREMRRLFEDTIGRQSARINNTTNISGDSLLTITAADIPVNEHKNVDLNNCLGGLDELVGLDNVKEEVRQIASYINMENERARASGNNPETLGMHFVFTGNPGTGKTTVARILADTFKSLGLLSRGHLIEADRSDLVAGYSGQTAIKTNQLIDDAMGGVLFIDEAYTLASSDGDGFGKEAIDTLLKRMMDDRGKFICIVAGYNKEMYDFLSSNTGLRSRFNKAIEFEDYTPEQLTTIFKNLVKKKKMRLSPDAEERIEDYFKKMYISRDKSFGNAREVVAAFELALQRQGTRLASIYGTADYNPDLLDEITWKDISGEEADKVKTIPDILAELDEFIGMESVKTAVKSLARKIEFNKIRQERGIGDVENISLNLMLTGNPGTGKTTVARKLGEIFKAIGLLPTDKVIETDRSEMVGQYVGETPKIVSKLCDRAQGGILFVDEAYTLAPQDASGQKDQYGTEAIETLMKRMEDDRGKFVVILAGYQTQMENFVRVNPGIDTRITDRIHIDDYTAEELFLIFEQFAKKDNFKLDNEAQNLLKKYIDQLVANKSKNFGNARDMRKLFGQVKDNLSNRLAESPKENLTDEDYITIRAVDVPYDGGEKIDVEKVLSELNTLVGLNNIKEEVRSLVSFLNMETERAQHFGGTKNQVGTHFIFTGNPGTGKTTVARILANVFKSMGILSRGHLVEVDRSGLVAGYSGQTAIKTNQLIDSALGGVLFIDEAYNLITSSQDSFGKEAVDTLLKRLEDDRGKFICIVAGYSIEMKQFLESNSGLISRFPRTLHFEDYNASEMLQIFENMAKKKNLEVEADAIAVAHKIFDDMVRNKDRYFANARNARILFDQVLKNQGNRLADIYNTPEYKPEYLTVIKAEDIRL